MLRLAQQLEPGMSGFLPGLDGVLPVLVVLDGHPPVREAVV
jgi:hypothetical protein